MFYSLAALVLKVIVKLLLCYKVEKDYTIDDGPVVLVANHRNMWDPVLVSVAFKRQIHWMCKEELFENKFLNLLFNKLGAFPIAREGSDIKAMRLAMKYLKNEEVIGIFPEGTRVKEIDLDRGKSGTALLASRMEATIVPVYIDADYKFFGENKVIFRKPMTLEKGKRKEEEYKQDMRKIMEVIYFGGELDGDSTC